MTITIFATSNEKGHGGFSAAMAFSLDEKKSHGADSPTCPWLLFFYVSRVILSQARGRPVL
jgi:hypothetical protein